MTFADRAELAVYQGKPPFDPVKGAQADLVLELVTAAIISEAGQSIELATTTAALAGTWDRDLELPERPVVSVASVTVNGLALVQNSDYFFNPGGFRIRRGAPFAPSQSGDWYGDDDVDDYDLAMQGDQLEGALGAVPMTWGGPTSVVNVEYTHGRDPIPNLARLVCLAAADRFLSSPTGVVQESLGPYAATYASPHGTLELSPAEIKLVRRAFRQRARLG